MRPQMQPNQARATGAPPYDFAITTEFIRQPVDVDDTVPIALYSQPYERLEIELATRPVKRDPAPSSPLVLVVTILLLLGAFVLGFSVPALLL